MPKQTKTHCVNGHELTDDNVLWRRRGGIPLYKRCKVCQYAANERSIQRKIAAYKAEHGISS
ncbi:hypothetical protein [Rhodococcus qingshengii]|uniref:hypothetical protein n=1 Tax=Rhodococcus qingshengii TaxID=334542 RepID=UPI00187814E3|nr:hypothetical protein [Rhodococcus qingshengii]QOS62549.1 hypothetical protein IM699_25075 [Rhodococcus qingshengii]